MLLTQIRQRFCDNIAYRRIPESSSYKAPQPPAFAFFLFYRFLTAVIVIVLAFACCFLYILFYAACTQTYTMRSAFTKT